MLNRRALRYLVWAIATTFCVLILSSTVGIGSVRSFVQGSLTQASSAQASSAQASSAQAPLIQAQEAYESGRFHDAEQILDGALAQYQAGGDRQFEAAALSNLSLVHQALGNWAIAETLIQQSLEILQSSSVLANTPTYAQALETKGTLQLSRGNPADALEIWDEANQTYRAMNDELGQLRIRLNQATALQVLGLHRQAVEQLEDVITVLDNQPDSLSHVIALQNLGNSLRRVGNLQESKIMLHESLAMATRLSDDEAIATSQLALANTILALGDDTQALDRYDQASRRGSPMTRVYAELNRLRVLIERNQITDAEAIIPVIEQQLAEIPSSRMAAIAYINLAKRLMVMGDSATVSYTPQTARYLAQAHDQAEQLSDRRVKALSLGYLGELYERNRQWSDAQTLSEQALDLSDAMNAADLAYRWQWQLGRIYKAQDKREGAIAAYDGALENLEKIRSDLIATSADVQFSFRDEIEPIYRELVSLLLDPNVTPSARQLEKARKTIESLQLAELDNFFRAACLNATEVRIDDLDRQAAVIYPIALPDRLEVIVSLPESTLASGNSTLPSSQALLLRHTTMVEGGRNTIEQTAQELLARLKQPMFSKQATRPAQDLYDWMIRPFNEEFQANQVTQLVFVLDDVLRNLPMAVLYDGEQYLVEHYSLAITPGLQLLSSESVQSQRTSVLLAGISEPRQGFSALPGVLDEVEAIQDSLSNSQVLVNQDVTSTTLQSVLSSVPSRVVHLATHGQFSSKLEDTFVLTWDGRIQIEELSTLLERRELSDSEPIELLVLSACETAEGDRRATLGLAGIAVRSGARSTIASLWQLQDVVAPVLMEEFYHSLFDDGMTKAEALRQAQLNVLNQPEFRAPLFWAPVVLVGNWL